MKDNGHEGLFITVDIHNQDVHSLIDTGSTMSVLHASIFFYKLPNHIQKTFGPLSLQSAYGER